MAGSTGRDWQQSSQTPLLIFTGLIELRDMDCPRHAARMDPAPVVDLISRIARHHDGALGSHRRHPVCRATALVDVDRSSRPSHGGRDYGMRKLLEIEGDCIP